MPRDGHPRSAALRSTLATEIPGAPAYDDDREARPYDPLAARRIWAAFAGASRALERRQSSSAGQRPPVGIMWGAFDLAATRFRGLPATAVSERPVFLRNGMTQEEIAVGFSIGDDASAPGFYAYAIPALPAFATADLGPGATERGGGSRDAPVGVRPHEPGSGGRRRRVRRRRLRDRRGGGLAAAGARPV